MRSTFTFSALIAVTSAAGPFLNEPDTVGQLPDLVDIQGAPDFDFAARNYLNASDYSFYRTGAAGEWSYRNNLEAFTRIRWQPHVLNDVSGVGDTLPTTILAYNFSAPFFISPATRAGLRYPQAERNLVWGAYGGDILYIPAIYVTLSIEEIAAAKNSSDQVLFQQLYTAGNLTTVQTNLDRAKAAGFKAIVFTIDAPATSTRHRASRYSLGNANSASATLTWDLYAQLRNMTSLPVILKVITAVDDIRKAISVGAPAINISNHGGRQLDGSPSPFEVCLEICESDPTLFDQIEILADSGVRYGTDVLKLLALGVKAIGMGRPFMYANTYGLDGVSKLIEIMKTEITADAANAGIADIHNITIDSLNLKPDTLNVF